MSNELIITDYNPQWPQLFGELRSKLSNLLGETAAAIEHVGSTAVPGLAAKPVIDLDVLLASSADLAAAIERLATVGYEHQGDLGIAGREAFRSPPGLFAHHLYVCRPDCEEFRRHILLRDYLRSHPDEVAAYSQLKWSLLAKVGNDRAAYIRGKDDFMQKLIRRAAAAAAAQLQNT
jgi:GrpB-like predicted nucleotidyltransferase (UPF0157 family)